MNNCKNCNSNSTYTRCNPQVSSDCVTYQGEAKTCPSDDNFSICKGENMSQVQSDIFNKICELSGTTDISSITIPSCLIDAWNNQDLTILNLFSLTLNNACELQTQITNNLEAQNNLDPLVSICLSCCSPDGDCNSTAKVQLSIALEKIIQCICDAKAQINTLINQVNILESSYNGLQEQLTVLTTFNTQQVILNLQLQQAIAGIKCGLDSEGIPYTC